MTVQPSLAFSQEAGTIPVLGFGTSPMTGGMFGRNRRGR